MNMWKRLFLSTALLFLFAVVIAPVASAKSFPSTSTDDVMKSWNIKFSQQVDAGSVTEQTVYILEGTRKHAASVQLLPDGKTVKVTPRTPYVAGKTYKLEITNKIRSIKNKVMSSKTTMPFEVVDSLSPIQVINYSSGEGLHHFQVTTKYEVHSVKINNVSLRMTGVNEFAHTFIGLKAGSSVTVRAYGETGKLLDTKMYAVD